MHDTLDPQQTLACGGACWDASAMPNDPLSTFASALHGRAYVVGKRDYDWALDFGDQFSIAVSVPWRIVSSAGIAFADSDDGQRFGPPEPIVGATRANTILMDRRVTRVEVDLLTADLHVYFDGETRIDVFNHSSGYEGWQASYPSESGQTQIIGLGGGDLAIFHQTSAV
jgi:hypothetical protein